MKSQAREMIEGPEAFVRFREAVKKVLTVEQWKRIARALRLHGLRIVDKKA